MNRRCLPTTTSYRWSAERPSQDQWDRRGNGVPDDLPTWHEQHRRVTFVSRGDQSGTHTKEQDIWKQAGYNYTSQIRGSGAWYVEAGQGMGATLQLADQKQGYTLSDLGTFLAYKGNLTLVTLGSRMIPPC